MALNRFIKRVRYLIAGLIIAASGTAVYAQSVALKTNLLYDATATVNAGVEFQLAPRWSLDISGNLNAWTIRHHRWKHWLAQPEARYWLCEATTGHFFALHALGGQYNIGHLDFMHDFLGINFSRLADHRYQGWFIGAGIGYGYSWLINPHWNIEAEVAVGWIHTRYDIFECEGCGRRTGNAKRDYVAPTKLAVNLVYVF